MKKTRPAFLAVAIFALVSCVTINIYFPAEEVRTAADKITSEVWGSGANSSSDAGASSELRSFFRQAFSPQVAHAQQDIDINTPEIRAIRDSIKNRSSSIIPFMDSGHIGLGNDGLLKLRTADGLDLRARAEANRLITADNNDRNRLYAAIARANGFPDRVDETKNIFAESWKREARSGWYIEDARGNWSRK